MTIFKIRHTKTGLFYTPTKGRWIYEKTNLHKDGKLYTNKPNLKHISGRVHVSYCLHKKYDISGIIHLSANSNGKYGGWFEFNKKDWEIVIYKLTELEQVVY